MDSIKRILQEKIEAKLIPGKAVLLFGARRTGKTFLINEILKKYSGKYLLLNGEDSIALNLLAERSISNYRNLLKGVELLAIDEAQNIPEIGKIMKLIVDEVSGVKILASGSSSFDLLNKSGEPLTGRSFHFQLYPIAQMELSEQENLLEIRQNLESRLIYGMYPEVVLLESPNDKKDYLINLASSYLLKDILAINGLRNSSIVKDLLRLLAFQLGKEVSNEELARQLGISKNTVGKYLDLLSKTFVIFSLTGYSKNLRKEIKSTTKWYFYDNGIRNTLIGNYNSLILRTDTGEVWENYLISERIKKIQYQNMQKDIFFWRTYDQQEIDVVERGMDSLEAYEIKWKEKSVKTPGAWAKTYPDAKFNVISQNNYLEWIA